jgi:hypothetical protein
MKNSLEEKAGNAQTVTKELTEEEKIIQALEIMAEQERNDPEIQEKQKQVTEAMKNMAEF